MWIDTSQHGYIHNVTTVTRSHPTTEGHPVPQVQAGRQTARKKIGKRRPIRAASTTDQAPSKPRTAAATGKVRQPRPGTDAALAAELLEQGGTHKRDIIAQLDARLKELGRDTTSKGTPKNAASIIGATLTRMINNGWAVESSFRLVPPDGVTTKAEPAKDTTDNEKEAAPSRPLRKKKPLRKRK
jgi:hypothetical protein